MTTAFLFKDTKTDEVIAITKAELSVVEFLNDPTIEDKTNHRLCRKLNLPLSGIQSMMRTMRARKILKYDKKSTKFSGRHPNANNQIVTDYFNSLVGI